jgi:signal transduction histidine kinase
MAAADRLLGAFDLLSRQGTGQNAWAAPLRHDPIAFLLDTVGDAINLWGPRGELLYRNRAARELGLGSGDETALELFSARGEIYERRCLSHRAGGTQYMVEIIREIRPAAQPAATTETRPGGSAENRGAGRTLEPGDLGSEAFIVTLAHELRGPLQVLTLNADTILALMRRRSAALPAPLLRSKLEHQRSVVIGLQRLTDALVESCRMAHGQLGFRPEPIDLGELVRQTLAAHADALHRAGCSYSLRTTPSVVGRWDRLQLRLAVGNLVGNAAKYAPGRPVEVAVEAHETIARVRVRDHGSGIRPEDHERIFERFSRGISDWAVGGFGWGLWLVKQVALAHGGDVSVVSVPGHGATFNLELPRS